MQHRINNPSVISESLDGEVVVIHLAPGTTYTDMQDLILLDPVHEVEPARGWPATGEPVDG